MLLPKLITTLREGYTLRQFWQDTLSGLVVGVVALPLAIAFAIASGVSPDRGLYTAVLGGFIVAVFGGSRVQIAGPTGAFVVVVYSVVHQFGVQGLLLATLMAGVLLVVMGLCGLGAAIKFIPYPVTVGFTSGIALIIFSAQINDLLGLGLHDVPAGFFEKWSLYFRAGSHVDGLTAVVGFGSLVLMLLWRRRFSRIPAPLVALIAATLAVKWLGLPVETIGMRFGELPHTFPTPALPPITFELLRQLSPAAVTIALLAGIEALLSAVVADGMIGGRHRSNMELVAQGLANLASPLFGGIPVTGAIARTATNVQNGGRTPVAGIVHSVTLLLLMLVFAPVISWIPLSCLAAILLVVAYNMSEWRTFMMLLRSPRSDVAVLLVTFLLTVVVDLTVAIQVGMVLAVLLFMRRMAQVSYVQELTAELIDQEEPEDPLSIERRVVPDDVQVYEIAGPFFFGASYKFREAVQTIHRQPRACILRMRKVQAIDATGLHALKGHYHHCLKHGIRLVISGAQAQPLKALRNSGLYALIGEENFAESIDVALKRVQNGSAL